MKRVIECNSPKLVRRVFFFSSPLLFFLFLFFPVYCIFDIFQIYRFYIFNKLSINIADPALVRKIIFMPDSFQRDYFYSVDRVILGDVLFAAEGEHWRTRRYEEVNEGEEKGGKLRKKEGRGFQ